METRGIEPRASRMRSERSTIWATSPSMLQCWLHNFYLRVNPPFICISFYLQNLRFLKNMTLIHRVPVP